jgi:hypothetical protein
MRRMVQRLDGMAFLLGTRPQVAIEIASHIADGLKGLERPPAVCIVGESGESAAACVRLLQGSGVDAFELPLGTHGGAELSRVLPALGVTPQGISVSPTEGSSGPVPANRMDGPRHLAFVASNP